MTVQGKLSRREMLKWLGVGASVAALSACQPGVAPAQQGNANAPAAAGAGNLTYWFFVGGPNLDNQKKLVEEYNSSTSGAKVTLEHTPEIKEKTLAAYAAGNPPNVTWYPTGGWGALGFANTAESDAKSYADSLVNTPPSTGDILISAGFSRSMGRSVMTSPVR